ncbi:MAG: hypothetical protein IT372_00130 [Polyangiaceae bacterium]|nr:hypothetical protein [Polyangiaceae bacterium]
MTRRRPLGCVLPVERAGEVRDLAIVGFASSEREVEEVTLVVFDCDTQGRWSGLLSPKELAEARRGLALDWRLQSAREAQRIAFAAVGGS